MGADLAVVPVPGELAVDLPGGKVKCWYFVEGDPKTYYAVGEDSTWDTRGLAPTFTPLGGAPPIEVKPSRLTAQSVKQKGTSKKRWLVLKVPKPGGRYLVSIPEGLGDDKARMVLKN